MKISYSWLKDYVDHGLSPEALADRLTMAGLEVEAVEATGPAFDGVVVGHVLEVASHPNADRLTLCRVDLGDGVTVQIVCGAPNVAAGQKVPVATPGAVLPHPKHPGKTFKIEQAKIRGAVSMGMICAEDELGLSDDHSGIMVLDEDAPAGQPFAEYLEARGRAARDVVLDVAVTPNRPDAVSHLGVARDVAALVGAPLRRPEVPLPEPGGEAARHVHVTIEAPEGCGRYVAMLVRGVTVRESPAWLRRRLEAVGLRPRNNIVDITNYVMYECGQPLHAFDFDRIAGQRIIVRFTRQEQPFVTLDDKTRHLPAGTLMIADAERDVAIAGVMGGQNSEVGEATTNVLIESAYFDPATIRRTAKALQLATDASYRFERGVDPEGQVWAAARAAHLMAALGGGEVVPGLVDVHPRPVPRRTVRLRLHRLARILGVSIPGETVQRLLTAIGFEPAEETPGVLACRVPSFRPDVEREIDVIEEVGRLYGFDRIPEPTHSALPVFTPREAPAHTLRRRTLALLSSLGYREVYTNSMMRRETAERFFAPALLGFSGVKGLVETLNPISQEMAALRPTLLPGLLQVMAHNRNHGQHVLRFMEFGHVYFRSDDGSYVPGYAEHETFLLALSGPRTGIRWDEPPRPADFFDLKGDVEALLEILRVPDVTMTPDHTPGPLTAYRLTVHSGNVHLGYLARLADALTETYDLKEPVFVAELNWQALVERAAPFLQERYAEISRFPVVERDLAVLVERDRPAGLLLETIRQAGRPLLQQATVFDLYAGPGIPEGKKSVAFALRFGADRTLTDEEVDACMNTILERLTAEHGAELRQ
ncbi:phenylalanine--tRNA ligase subunit beta [Rhodocaloribacter litoris]|uniref:phenylalanine--tRNA ligase subunit beta n=1 Tax=Rhodocaloribacter litoris TaxID=2558931 RepID=UPI00141F7938|nr:phenylalanine--tRNA ligase subunit beta [Rhodocaloribacter litoris]QXD15006.1 phenylalanine--tRNA ligase subunit beta [Rhodocaloribacter litoris]